MAKFVADNTMARMGTAPVECETLEAAKAVPYTNRIRNRADKAEWARGSYPNQPARWFQVTYTGEAA